MLSSDWEPLGTIHIPLSLRFLHETPPVCISDVEHSLGLTSAMLGKPCSHSLPPPSPEHWLWQGLQMASRNARGCLGALGVKFSLITACLREEPIREAISLEQPEECVDVLASEMGSQ